MMLQLRHGALGLVRGPASRYSRLLSSVSGREPLLFTPGPLTTSLAVKQAMMRDLGSRDPQFVAMVREVRDELLKVAGTSQDAGYEAIIIQGAGTMCVESVVSSVVPGDGRLLVCSNGAYGERIATMCEYHGIPHDILRAEGENLAVAPAAVEAALAKRGDYTHVAAVHHETTAGTLNDVAAIGRIVRARDPALTYIVDSMSAFGCYEVDLAESNVHFIVSSANKNIEGVPGFGFCIADRSRLQAEGKAARALSLDLLKQWEGLEVSGQFRFTPPVHSLAAFRQALRELDAEGGVPARRARYEANAAALDKNMKAMGFSRYVAGGLDGSPDLAAGVEPAQGCIIHTYLFPDAPGFDFTKFYDRLASLGCVIYPGKLTKADCFRIGSIGRLFEKDMIHLTNAVKLALEEQSIPLPVTQITP